MENRALTVSALTKAIRDIAGCQAQHRQALESYLEQELIDLPINDRVSILEEVIKGLGTPPPPGNIINDVQHSQFERLATLLLGKKPGASAMSPEEFSSNLTKSLNTVLDTLNEIVSLINTTLRGRQHQQDTIRHIINSEIEGRVENTVLQDYLDQIQEAFLIAYKASAGAANAVLKQVLAEIDPEKPIALSGLLRFGPMRKAALYDIYRERFQVCRKALESGRMEEVFLREYEKTCEKLYETKPRRK